MYRTLRRRGGWILACLLVSATLTAVAVPAFIEPGLIVQEVGADTPAAKAGIKVGDKLLAYDGKPLTSFSALVAAQENTFDKKDVALRLSRGGETLTVTVPVGKLGLAVRRELLQAVEPLYAEGEAALDAENYEKAVSVWTTAAIAALGAGDKGAAGWLYEAAGRVHEQRQQWGEASKLFATALKLVEETGDAAAQSNMLTSLAACSQSLGDYDGARRWYERAVQVDTAAGHPMWAADDLTYLGDLSYSGGDGHAARSYYGRALDIHERLVPGSAEVAADLQRLGDVAFALRDLPSARGYFDRALKIRERVAPASAEVVAALIGLGNIAHASNNLAAAQSYFGRALNIGKGIGPESDEVALSLGGLGNVAYSRNDLPAAEEYFGGALKIFEKKSPVSTEVASALISLGNVALGRNNRQAAHNYYYRALGVLEKTMPGTTEVASVLDELGNVAYLRRDLAAAQDYFGRALKIYQQSADPESLKAASTLNNLGTVADEQGDLAAAQDYFERALKIRARIAPGSPDVAASLGGLGNVARLRGDLKKAQDFYTQSWDILKGIVPAPPDAASALGNLGNVARLRGDLTTAEDYYRRALEIFEKSAPNSPSLPSSFIGLGNVLLERGDYEGAEQYFGRAHTFYVQVSPASLDVADSLVSLGNVALARDDLATAKERYTDALGIHEKLAPGTLSAAATLGSLGDVASLSGDLPAARGYYARALEIFERLAPDSLSVALTLSNLGANAYSSGDVKAARDYYDRALRIHQQSAPDDSLGGAQILSNIGYAALFERRLPDALSVFKSAVDMVETQRGRVLSPEVRALLLARYPQPYTGLLRTQLALNDLPAAFATSERARARSLVQLLTERRLDLRPGESPDLLKEQDELDIKRSAASADVMELRLRVAELRIRLAGSKEPEQRARLNTLLRDYAEQISKRQQELAQYSVRQRELDESFRRSSPKLAALTYPQPLDLKGAQAALDSDTLLLSYYVSERETYLFAVGKNEVRVFTISAGRDALIGHLQAFRNEVAVGRRGLNDPSSIRTAAELGKRLYDLLVGPAQGLVGQAKRILICPDGPLHALPFAALVSRADPAPRYLVEDKPLHTIVSMTVYAETRNLPAPKNRREARLLAFGDPLYQKSQKEVAAGRQPAQVAPDRAAATREPPPASQAAPSMSREFGLAPLQGSGQEVEAISDLFGGAAAVRRGPGATESAAKQESKDYSILHFAVHGLLDERVGLDSFLALSQPDALGRTPTKDDNGLWQAWEILERARLDADLVVLSACETGRGQDIPGEGLVGLTRAFQYAGARSIVVSLWNVNDVSTATFMTVFYRELRGGTTKDVALQKAMVAVLNDQRWRHPFYWSPFILVGAWQ